VIPKLLAAWSLLAVSVAIHATGLAVVLRRAKALPVAVEGRIWPVTWLLIRVAWGLIILHLLEIIVWAVFYWWQRCLPDLESAFYFSGVTYTTVGYGDLVLPQEWRLLGPVEALTGILMCGLSTGYFFAMVSTFYGVKNEP
jgi:voltage-gated potassium channel Kch